MLTVLIIKRANVIKIVSAVISSTVIDIEDWNVEWGFSCTLELLVYDLRMTKWFTKVFQGGDMMIIIIPATEKNVTVKIIGTSQISIYTHTTLSHQVK